MKCSKCGRETQEWGAEDGWTQYGEATYCPKCAESRESIFFQGYEAGRQHIIREIDRHTIRIDKGETLTPEKEGAIVIFDNRWEEIKTTKEKGR